jgi:uncharacterized protein with HEPN domain
MLSNAAIAALRDIAQHIDLAIQFTEGFDYEAFVADPRAIYAVARCLEIISEASRRLPDDLKARHLQEGRWRKNWNAAERVKREQIAVAGDNHIGMAITASSRNLSTVGSRHAAIRSVIATSSAAIISFGARRVCRQGSPWRGRVAPRPGTTAARLRAI